MKLASFALLASTALYAAPAIAAPENAGDVATVASATADNVANPDDQSVRDRDIVVTGERTEGDGSYTVGKQRTATRMPLSLRETPQSVSVVTRAQIDDFQLNDVNQLLGSVPGVNVQAVETDRFYYSARGFDIQTFQIDGIGQPFAYEIATGSMDTAIYDHIEVVRGAPGLLSPTGNPSAVINFVRKRPTRTLKASASAQYGSFDHLRLDGDASVPLTKDGSVRARGVGAYLDQDSYLDRYGLKRWTGYGIVEADLGPDTVISAGYGHQKHESRGAMWGALPLYYTDGTRVDYDRSANSAPQWSNWAIINRQIFGDITHEFANGWVVKASAMREAVSENDELFYVYGNPVRGAPGNFDLGDPANPNDDQGIITYPGAFAAETRNLTLDINLGGKISLFGRDHDVMIGFTRAAQHYDQQSSYDESAVGQFISIADMLAGTFPRPDFPADYDDSLDRHTRRETVYGLLRLNLSDPFKIMLGGNYTHAMSEGISYGVPANYDRSRFLPFIGATYDINANVSAYASYATIFNPQTQIDADFRILDPIKGNNVEVGLKGAWYDGRLNASIAVFQARQDNTAESAGFDPDIKQTIYKGVDAKSQGIELEVGGELLPGLQATGGFTTMRIVGTDNRAARTFVPRNTARLNLTYSPPSFDRVKVGGSVSYQSKIYNAPGTVSTTTGEPVRITQGGYAVVNALASYRLTDRVNLAVNVRNITNAKYLTALNTDQGYYAPPRSVLGTIRVGF
tara:strand:+ start:626 stop:2854 length:2229 start_codon:yes stop_codon:yes gene_type:complete